MRGISQKTVIVILYIMLMFMTISMVFGQIPLTERTLPFLILILLLFVFGLALILGWDLILPSIIKSYRLGDCKVVNKRYVICRYKNSPEVTGYVFAKVVPVQPIADMDRERRMSYLDVIQGLLAGAHFEVIVAYIGMRDRYEYNILKKLDDMEKRILSWMSIGRGENPRRRYELERIMREKTLLLQVPVILEGFYICAAREYGKDEDELVSKLESDARSLINMLGRLGVKSTILEGEELRNILMYMLFGSVVQIYF